MHRTEIARTTAARCRRSPLLPGPLAALLALACAMPAAASELTTPEQADALIAGQGYPLSPAPARRFEGFVARDDLAEAGAMQRMRRALRFAHITDMQLVDDDAPFPMRQGLLDEFYAATISSSAERPQEEFADEIMQSLVEVVNAHHRLDAIEFAIHTGDNIDNALENEAIRYLDLLEGTNTKVGPISGLVCQPDGQSADRTDHTNDQTITCTALPEALAGKVGGFAPDLPSYVATGNHDLLVQGNVGILPAFGELANGFGRHFLHLDEYVAMHFNDLVPCNGGTPSDDYGHGFGFADTERRCDDLVENDGYYAFEQGGVLHVVLDTVNDDLFQNNENLTFLPDEGATGHDAATGLSEGALDIDQWHWLQAQLETNADKPVILYSHHTMNSFYSDQFDALCGPPGCMNDVLRDMGFLGRDDIREKLESYPNLLAWIGGHTHSHRVTPIISENGGHSFWNVETAGLLDLPQESRLIEIWADPNTRKGFIALDPVGHAFEPARELAGTDDQHDGEAAAGGEGDRRVLLWFDVPAGVSVPARTPGRTASAD